MALLTMALEASISYFYFLFNHWGWAIFALAVVIRVVLFPIQVFNFKQQRLMGRIQPEVERMKDLYKDDPMKFLKASSEVRKREGVRAGWSFLTSLVQVPIFISIYKVFSSMHTLMGGNFAWLTTLGSPDPLFVFPLIVAITSFAQQKANPPPTTSENSGMTVVMKFMPVLSLAVMMTMPSGLVAYYAVSGVLRVVGDFVVRRG